MTIRILLADDHVVVRDGLRLLLEFHPDLKVVGAASTGREAVRLAQQLRPDVVVMDIAMPELNGLEATQQIRDALPQTHVIILSMHATSEHIFRALRAGARGYLLKDVAGAEVVAAVRAVFAGERYLSQAIATMVVDDYVRQGPATPSPLESLSGREREVLQLVAEGLSSAEVAARLSLSPKTVDTYRSRLMQKLGVNDLPALIRFAIAHGLTK